MCAMAGGGTWDGRFKRAKSGDELGWRSAWSAKSANAKATSTDQLDSLPPARSLESHGFTSLSTKLEHLELTSFESSRNQSVRLMDAGEMRGETSRCRPRWS